ncbi:MAG: AMP-binding protein [Bacteroidaceae bacterium]|nr:AMP-binding protein [Bacteroidaceae bacterium]
MAQAANKLFDQNNTSLISMMENTIIQHWSMPAYTNYGTDVSYTYGDVAKMIARLHKLYKSLGIDAGDKIALCDKNNSNWAIAFHSVISYGAVVVPILSEFSHEQIQNIYEHSNSKLLICGERWADIIKGNILVTTDFHVKGQDLSIDMEAYKDLQPSDICYFRENPEALALLSYTSGSTGRSKGVMLPYRSLWSNMIFADEVLDFRPGDNTLAILPMAHMYGWAFDFFFEFLIGCHVHFLTKTPSPQVLIKAFNEIKPVVVIVVPLILEKIVQKKIFPILRTRSIRALTKIPLLKQVVYRQIRNKLYAALGGNFYECIIGGAAFNKEVEDFLNKIHFPYTVGYGMTECGPIIGYEDWKLFKKGSCGKTVPRMEVRILSPDPHNVPGEIITKGMNTMLGYYKNEAETLEAIDEEGWLHTGDLGTIDKDGNIFIRGRKKTMLLGANGQNVYPEEIEDIIMTQTIFEETVVVQREEKLVALVYISEPSLEHHGLTPETLRTNLNTYKRHINEKLPAFSQISSIEIQSQEFEKTPKRSIKRYLYK